MWNASERMTHCGKDCLRNLSRDNKYYHNDITYILYSITCLTSCAWGTFFCCTFLPTNCMVTQIYWGAFATAASISCVIWCNACQTQISLYVQLRLVTFDWQVLTNDFQQSAKKRIFCVFGGKIWEAWSRFVLTTGGTTRGHFWMQMIAETVGEFLQGDWGRSRLITGGTIGGYYCMFIHAYKRRKRAI